MVYGVVHFVEMFFWWVLHFIPYYDYVRLLGFAWLMLPQFKGATVLYEKGLKPFCVNNKDLINDIIDRTTSEAELLRQKAMEKTSESVNNVMNSPTAHDFVREAMDSVPQSEP